MIAIQKAGLTQQELAKRLKKTQFFVAKYEGGERRIDVLEFLTIARAVSEAFGWPATLEAKAPNAVGFYGIVAAVLDKGYSVCSGSRRSGRDADGGSEHCLPEPLGGPLAPYHRASWRKF
jgi:transcriptional regulator with XRE-family HTH domain